MIGKVIIGKSFGGCVSYVVGKKDAVILYSEGIRTESKRTITHDFNMQRKVNPGLGNAVGHISLNWSIHDLDSITSEKMLAIAMEYLSKMKIKDTQLLIVQHHDSNHPHLHIIYNRVDYNGKTISDHYQFKRNKGLCKELTLKYGHYISKGKSQVNRERLKGADQIRYRLYDQIKQASLLAKSWTQFQQLLSKDGISIQYKYKGSTSQVEGVSFSQGKYSFKGSQIDRNFSYGKLNIQFGRNQQFRKDFLLPQKEKSVHAVQFTHAQELDQQSSMEKLLNVLFTPIDSYTPIEDYMPWKRKKKKKKRNDQELSR